MSVPTHYQVLEVESTATLEQIKRAYRRLVRQWHPDVNPSTEASARFIQVQAAYEVLADAARRALYDKDLRGAASGRPPGGPSDHTGSSGSTAGSSDPQPIIQPSEVDLGEVTLGHRTRLAFELSIQGNLDYVEAIDYKQVSGFEWLSVNVVDGKEPPYLLQADVDTTALEPGHRYVGQILFAINGISAYATVGLSTTALVAEPYVIPPKIEHLLLSRHDATTLHLELGNASGFLAGYECSLFLVPPVDWVHINGVREPLWTDDLPIRVSLEVDARHLAPGSSHTCTLVWEVDETSIDIPITLTVAPTIAQALAHEVRSKLSCSLFGAIMLFAVALTAYWVFH